MKAGDLVLVQGNAVVELGIQALTRGPFDHIALAVSDVEIIEALPSGVVKSEVSGYERYAVYECVGITDEQRKIAVDYHYKHLGEAYDFLKDAGFAINSLLEAIHLERVSSLWESHGKIICSSLVDLSLRESAFILREDRQPGDLTPMSCIFTPKVRFIENHNLWEV